MPPPAEPPPSPQTDHNLAEMAQQLEAALRRAPVPESRPPVTDPLAAAPPKPAPPRDFKPRVEPKFEPKIRDDASSNRRSSRKAEPKVEPKLEPKLEPSAPPAKDLYDNLEEEMASLLGRPPGKTVTGISDRRVRLLTVVVGVAGLIAAAATPAGAQDISVNFGQGSGLTERVIQMIALLTVLSLAPSILVMMTSFTRIVVVLSLLRTALGTATAPPNAVIVSLALFLTAFVMGPALQKAYDTGVRPLVANEITAEQAFERGAVPLRAFMEKNVNEKDLKLFVDMSKEAAPAKPEDISLRVLVPAFMISELKRAFEIGFLLFLPFLIIDLVVASVLMSMGMMMLPPVVVSLPFKLIFFVLVDGWSLVAGSLIQSYGT